MLFDRFAGPIFSTEDVVKAGIVGLIIIIFVVSILLDISNYAYNKVSPHAKQRNFSSPKLKVIIIGVLLSAVVLFFAVPAKLRDYQWQKKQELCAAQVGYASPAENNSSKATAASQNAFRTCLR